MYIFYIHINVTNIIHINVTNILNIIKKILLYKPSKYVYFTLRHYVSMSKNCILDCCCLVSCSVMSDSFATPWTIALQTPLSMGFSRQEYWSGLPCPPPGDLPNPGLEVMSLTSPALGGRFFTTSATWKAPKTAQVGIIIPVLKSKATYQGSSR